MCRLLAYLGPPRTLEQLLLTPEHSLLRQSWAPRYQRNGVVNADGFGVGWYDFGKRREPARYRSARPMWTDRSFASIAGVIESPAVLAAVRSATPPAPSEESGVAPFSAGQWLFAHSGAVEGFDEGIGMELRRRLSDKQAGRIEGASDSEVLFATALDKLDRGARPADALASVVTRVKELSGGRLNLVLTDGHQVAATVFGDTLYELRGEEGGSHYVFVASEPFDDHPGWRQLPDISVLRTTAERFDEAPI